MYDLGEQFKANYKMAKTNPKCVVKGEKYRFTVITERLIRLEYNKNGQFEERPTELVKYRNLPCPVFDVKEDNRILEIKTKYFTLIYHKEKSFYGGKLNPTSHLKININNSDKFWYYGHPEVRNYGSPGISLEHNHGKLKFKKGLYSIDGFATLDDSNSSIVLENGTIIARDEAGIDLYVFLYGKDFSLCLKDYFDITGYPSLIPRYALGNWWTKNDLYDEYRIKRLVREFEEHEIPLSTIVLNENWHVRSENKNVYSGFTFNKEYFTEPKDTIDYLHSKGIRIGLNINPSQGLYPIEQFYDKIREYLKADADGVIPFNVFDPKFVDVYLKMCIHPLESFGVDFFWLDFCDKKDLASLALLKEYQFQDMMRNYRRRPMLLAYNALLAPHRYPVLYSGKTTVSWETLRQIPFYNSNASNMGVSFWSHDIGGYYKGIEDHELYTRFIQLGTFSPILKLGSEAGRYYKREPWKWEFRTYNIAKEYLTLRHKLIPYLYSESYKYHKFGTPIVQPLYYTVPDIYDDIVYRNEYFFGSEFYISPIVNKKDPIINRAIHKFYMPDGMWYDFVTGKKFPGGRYYVSFFKEEDYPVFVRAGSIIPLGYNENINDTNPPKTMEIHIFPGKSNLYTLYEDDGVSSLYDSGYYLTSSIDYNYMPNNYTVIIRALEGKSSIIPDQRNYRIVFRNTKMPDEILVFQNRERMKSVSYIDGPNFVVEIKDVRTIGQLTVNCKGRDIEIDAVRFINQDIEQILSDLQIETEIKIQIDDILFSNKTIKEKRIAIRKLANRGLERKFAKLFLKLLEYVETV